MNRQAVMNSDRNQPSRLELFRERLRGDTALTYRLTLIFFVVAYTVVIGLNIFLREPKVYNELPLHHQLLTSGTNYAVTEKYMSEDESKLTFVLNLYTGDTNIINFEELKFDYDFAGAKDQEERSLVNFYVVKGDNTYYEIHFDTMPEDWSALRFDVLNKEGKRLVRFYFNRVPTEDDFAYLRNDLDTSSEATTIRSIDEKVRLMNVRINEEIPEEIRELHEQQALLDENIHTIRAEQKYETTDQQKTSNARISSLNNSINSNKQAEIRLHQESQELSQRIELLRLKQDELIIKYGLDGTKVFFDR